MSTVTAQRSVFCGFTELFHALDHDPAGFLASVLPAAQREGTALRVRSPLARGARDPDLLIELDAPYLAGDLALHLLIHWRENRWRRGEAHLRLAPLTRGTPGRTLIEVEARFDGPLRPSAHRTRVLVERLATELVAGVENRLHRTH